jgi:methylenetetrahydrofolate--tRNA-(uracil-5-)-methyltransferase
LASRSPTTAIAPIVSADSIDWDRVFVASRYDKGETTEDQQAYVNCPMDRDEYEAFVRAVLDAKKIEPRDFEDVRYFEGCLPIEVMAARGPMTLAFGPMKPVGLVDPMTGRRRPHAVVQLRAEDRARTAFNMVGFQTRMTWPNKLACSARFGLREAEFSVTEPCTGIPSSIRRACSTARSVSRATPACTSRVKSRGPRATSSAALGYLAAHIVAARLDGRRAQLPPPTTAHGGLLAHVSRPEVPSNRRTSRFRTSCRSKERSSRSGRDTGARPAGWTISMFG